MIKLQRLLRRPDQRERSSGYESDFTDARAFMRGQTDIHPRRLR